MRMKSVKEMLLYVVAIFMLKGLSFIMLPMVTRFLTQAEYGQLNVLVSMAAVLSLLMTFGLGEALFRFAHTSRSTDEVMRQCLFLSTLICCVMLVLGQLLLTPILEQVSFSPAPTDVRLLLITLTAGGMLTVPYCYFRLTQNATAFAVFSIVQGALQTCLSVCFLLLSFGIRGLMYSGAISAVIILVAVLVHYRATWFGPRVAFNRTHYQYCLFILLSSLCLYGFNGAENWLVVAALGAEQLALFFAAAQFGLMVSVAFEPFRMWWYAKRFQFQENDSEQGAKFALFGVQLGMFLTVLMLIVAPTLLAVLLPAHFAPSLSYIPWFCLIMVARFHAELLNLGCYLKKSASLALFVNGTTAVYLLVAGYIALAHWELNGLFAVMVSAAFIRAILFFTISQYLLPLAYPFRQLALSWLIFLVVLGQTLVFESQSALPLMAVFINLVAIVLNLIVLSVGYQPFIKQCYQRIAGQVRGKLA